MDTALELKNSALSEHAELLDHWFERRFAELMKTREQQRTPSLSIMVTKGTLDWAYPPFILASTAKALGWNVNLFFTFYGLNYLKKQLDLKISALGNPAMPMKMPFGPSWFRNIEWNMPNLVMAIPGFETLATTLMKETVAQKGVAPIMELRENCIETEVQLVACQMTVDLFGWRKEDFIPEITEWAGAASYLTVAQKSDMSLYI